MDLLFHNQLVQSIRSGLAFDTIRIPSRCWVFAPTTDSDLQTPSNLTAAITFYGRWNS